MIEAPRNGHSSLPDHATLWRNPASLIESNKKELQARGESTVERLESTPIPIRIHSPIILSPEQIIALGGESNGEKIIAHRERDTQFTMIVFGDKTTGEEHVAIVKNLGDGENVPIRVHSSCVTAESFHASNCDCQEQLDMALDLIDREGRGGLLWLHQEGRGNGLAAKAQQLNLMMTEGIDTVTAFEQLGYPGDQRDYTVAADMLRDMGVKSVVLITNSPDKMGQLERLGIEVTGRIPCEIKPINNVVKKDLAAKRTRLGHFLPESNSST